MRNKFSIIFIALAAALLPNFSPLMAVDFSQAKTWNYANSQLQDVNFTAENLRDWDSFKIKTIDLGHNDNKALVVAPDMGAKPEVRILGLDGHLLSSWLAYDAKMLAGVEIDVADVNQDGFDEIITGVGDGAGSHVRFFNSAGQTPLNGWFAFPGENHGVKIAAVQANQDSSLEIAAAIYQTNRILLKIFTYQGRELNSFVIPYDLGIDFKLAAIDLGGDGLNELIIAAGAEHEPYVYLYRLHDGSLINKFLAYDPKFKGGFQVAAIDLENHGQQEIITAPQLSGGPHVRAFNGYGLVQSEFMAADQSIQAGLNFTLIGDQVFLLPARQTTGRTDWEKYIEIDISDQRLDFYNYHGIKTASYPVSTGTVQMPTPLGEYTIDYKEPNRFSRAYGLYMPFWMAFNVQKGYGIHELPYWPSGYREGTDHLGLRVSHGCVRLGIGNAEKIYQQTPLGTKVIIQQ